MTKNFVHSKVVALSKIHEAIDATKSTKEVCAINISVINELRSQSERILIKYRSKWGYGLIHVYERRIELYNNLNSIHNSILDGDYSKSEIEKYVSDAEELYDIVLSEYTVMFPTFENADSQEKKRLIEEIFIPLYLLIIFLKRIQDANNEEEYNDI